MTRRRTLIFRALLIVYLIAVAYLCFGHVDQMPHVSRSFFGFESDKIAHFLMFLPFPVLTFFSYDRFTNKVWSALLFAVITFAIGCALSAATELIQGTLAYRTADPKDFLADIISLGLSTTAVMIIDLIQIYRADAK